jgi:hypothetical protein
MRVHSICGGPWSRRLPLLCDNIHNNHLDSANVLLTNMLPSSPPFETSNAKASFALLPFQNRVISETTCSPTMDHANTSIYQLHVLFFRVLFFSWRGIRRKRRRIARWH